MEFNFKIDGQTVFSGKLVSLQCTAHKKNNAQCKRKCVIGTPYCYTHLMYNEHLRIKESTIPNTGFGLFAMDPMAEPDEIIFKSGKKITQYHGEIIDIDELIERYGNKTAPYTIEIREDDLYEDGAIERGVGAIANTKPNHNNATISIYRGRASLKASKNIRNGEEIFLSYGRSFKVNQAGVEFSTKRKK